mgnify:CR=1 FL=1
MSEAQDADAWSNLQARFDALAGSDRKIIAE